MEINDKAKFWLLFLIKFVLATIVFYIGFSYNLKQIGYETSYISDYDYVNQLPVTEIGLQIDTGLDQDLNVMIQELLDPMHQVSDTISQDVHAQRFEILCNAHRELCNKVRFVGDFSAYEQLIYFVGILHVVNQTDRLLQQTGVGSLLQTLHTITINSRGGQRRGGATWHTVVINTQRIQSFMEFFEVFTHEIGHIVDLGVLQGVSRSQNQQFTEFGRVVFAADDPSIDYYALSWRNESTRLALSRSEDFCSGYGMTNPFEDFAECFNLYMNHNAYFRWIAQDNQVLTQKYNFLANILAGSFLFAAPSDVQRAQSRRVGWRPWDTTRMR